MRVDVPWYPRSEFTVSVSFHRDPLVVPNSPGLCLPFFPAPFFFFTSHLSSIDRRQQRTGRFCLSPAPFEAFQSGGETLQTPKLETIRKKVTKRGPKPEGEPAHTHESVRTPGDVTVCGFSPSWPGSQTTQLTVAPCCPPLTTACWATPNPHQPEDCVYPPTLKSVFT